MRLRQAFFVLLLCVCCPAHAASRNDTAPPGESAPKVTTETLVSGGRKRTFYTYVPARAGAGQPAPLVLLLHPSRGNGSYLIEKWRELAEREGIVLVGPDALDSAKWSAPADGPAFLCDVVEAVGSKHDVDPRRVYLFGFSAGSGFAINMSLLQSEFFAATAAFASLTYREQYASVAARKIPFFFMAGGADTIFPLKEARAARDKLSKLGFPVEWKEMPDFGHDYGSHAEKINLTAWEFLKRHELAAAPRCVDYQFRK